jgi:hypothetical protein
VKKKEKKKRPTSEQLTRLCNLMKMKIDHQIIMQAAKLQGFRYTAVTPILNADPKVEEF